MKERYLPSAARKDASQVNATATMSFVRLRSNVEDSEGSCACSWSPTLLFVLSKAVLSSVELC